MDGFEGNTGIIIIAATNRPDVLDTALLRPDASNRQVQVDPPDLKVDWQFYRYTAKIRNSIPILSWKWSPAETTGFSGADLANLLNEAQFFTARRHKEAITMLEIDDAFDRIVAGMEGKRC